MVHSDKREANSANSPVSSNPERTGHSPKRRWALLAIVAAISATLSAAAFAALLLNDNDFDFDPTEPLLVSPAIQPDQQNQPVQITQVAEPAGLLASTAAPPRLRFTPVDSAVAVIASGASVAVVDLHLNSAPQLVPLPGGRTWMPWTDFEHEPYEHQSYERVSGVRPFWEDSLNLGADYFTAVESLWRQAMPPYTPAAADRLANGERLAQKTEEIGHSWERVIDPTGLQTKFHLSDNRRTGWEQVRLCSPHPASAAARDLTTYLLRDGDPQKIERAQELAQRIPVANNAANNNSGEYTQFVTGMKSPSALAVPSWDATNSQYARLLAYSPGEPTELASSGHSLTDSGFFPGDWSNPARRLLMQQAGAAALADANVWHSVQTTGPQSLWEACQDLVALSIGDNTDSERLARLETLWSHGLRLSFTSPPLERAYVTELSVTGRAQVLLCHRADEIYLTDAATGDRLEQFATRPERVEAQWLRWTIDGFRVSARAEFVGDCDESKLQGAFAKALAWGREKATESDSQIDRTQPHVWASGLNLTWIPVHEWVAISDEQVWRSHRDLGWSKRLICEASIARGQMLEGLLEQVPGSLCSEAELQAFQDGATNSPERTTELAGTVWKPEDSWFARMYLSPFRTIEEELGCAVPGLELVNSPESSSAPLTNGPHLNELRVKRPWPPWLLNKDLPGKTTTYQSPPHYPCPSAQAPPALDRYWWPPVEQPNAGASLRTSTEASIEANIGANKAVFT